MLDALPPCCAATDDLVKRVHRDLTCDCGERYLYDASTAERPALVPEPPVVEQVVRRPSGAQRDARVQVADDERLRPSSVAPESRERITRVDDAELVRVRRMLVGLRPERNGPLGWASDGEPPKVSDRTEEGRPILGALANRIRVQASAEVPSILPGAFARGVVTSAGAAAVERITEVTLHDPTTRATLTWLQREGTLAKGLGALYRLAAAKFSSVEKQARWGTLPGRMGHEAQTQAGRKFVLRAADAWEGLIEWKRCGACDGFDPNCLPCRGEGFVERGQTMSDGL